MALTSARWPGRTQGQNIDALSVLEHRVRKLQELTEIRAMHVTVAGHALHEFQSAVPSVLSEPELTIHTR